MGGVLNLLKFTTQADLKLQAAFFLVALWRLNNWCATHNNNPFLEELI